MQYGKFWAVLILKIKEYFSNRHSILSPEYKKGGFLHKRVYFTRHIHTLPYMSLNLWRTAWRWTLVRVIMRSMIAFSSVPKQERGERGKEGGEGRGEEEGEKGEGGGKKGGEYICINFIWSLKAI